MFIIHMKMSRGNIDSLFSLLRSPLLFDSKTYNWNETESKIPLRSQGVINEAFKG